MPKDKQGVSVRDVANAIRTEGLDHIPVEQMHDAKFAAEVCAELGIEPNGPNQARVIVFMRENNMEFAMQEYPKWVGSGEQALIVHNEQEERAYLEKIEGDDDDRKDALRMAREQEAARLGGAASPATRGLAHSKGAPLQYDGEANPLPGEGATDATGQKVVKTAHYGEVREGKPITGGENELQESKTLDNPNGGGKPPPYEPGAVPVIEPGGQKGPEASPVSDNRVNDDITPAEQFATSAPSSAPKPS